MVSIGGGGLQEATHGIIHSAGLQVEVTEVILSGNVLGSRSRDFHEPLNSVPFMAGLNHGGSVSDLCLRGMRSQAKGLLELGEGFISPAGTREGVAEREPQ